jgi:hypothetical protein
MSSGHVSDIANQLPMPSRPEEFTTSPSQAGSGAVAELKWESPRLADFTGLRVLGEGYPR